MLRRTAITLLTVSLAGCASESTGSFDQFSRLGAPVSVDDAELPSQHLDWSEHRFGNPLSTRVLSAIAFERSTGMPAHPSRIIPNY